MEPCSDGVEHTWDMARINGNEVYFLGLLK